MSVNYFATLATISSFVIITIHPKLHFEIPNSGAEWYVSHSPALCDTMANLSRILLLSIGVSGFMFQLLLTEGLQREKAGRATNLIVSCPILSLWLLLTHRPVRSDGLRRYHRARRLGNYTTTGELRWQRSDYWICCLGHFAEEDAHRAQAAC